MSLSSLHVQVHLGWLTHDHPDCDLLLYPPAVSPCLTNPPQNRPRRLLPPSPRGTRKGSGDPTLPAVVEMGAHIPQVFSRLSAPPAISSESRNSFDLPKRGCGGHGFLIKGPEHWTLPGRKHLASEGDVREAPGLKEKKRQLDGGLGTIKHACVCPRGKGN